MSNRYILPLMLAASFIIPGMIASADAASETRVYRWQTFDDWDTNHDGFIDGSEYENYSFGMADSDADGRLGGPEWKVYTQTFYDPWDVGYKTVTYYDTDGDGYLERKEFKRFVTVDDERANLYRTWDHDRDNRIGPDDWQRVTTYYTTIRAPGPAVPIERYND